MDELRTKAVTLSDFTCRNDGVITLHDCNPGLMPVPSDRSLTLSWPASSF